VDGYNLMKTDPELAMFQRAGIEAAREAVIRRLNNAAGLRTVTAITVVFDGHLGGKERESTERRGRITIIYSKLGENADTVIKRLVAAHPNPADVKVITRDNEIRSVVSSKGATPATMKRRTPSPTPSESEESEGWNKSTRKKGSARKASKKDRKRGPGNDVYW
jgi:predicted RNA-binding protein with PIN domain